MTPQLYSSLVGVRSFLNKHHPVIFIAFISLLLAAGLFSLVGVIQIANPVDAPSSTFANFDNDTIKKIKELHDSKTNSTAVVLPSPRPNPFVE